jgi:hypothetical protein
MVPKTGPAMNEPEPKTRQSAVGHARNTRQHSRFTLPVDVTVQSPTQGLVPANALDISESGISAVLPIHLPVGEIVELDFKLPVRRIRLFATVHQNHEFRYGFQFVEPDDTTLDTIRGSCRLLEQIDS